MQKYQEIISVVQEEIELVKKNLFNNLPVQPALKEKFEEIFNAPSKHIRPLVSFLYLKALGFDIDERQIVYQSAIEIVHNASLIHDDVIDNAHKRRNIKTINSVFGNKLAVLSGDYLLSQGLKQILLLKEPQLIKMFSDTLETMTNGEFEQYFMKDKIPSIEDYIEKSRQKTAKLFETAICGSLILADCDFSKGKIFAENIGIAFQIRDDLINCMTTKSDIQEGIYNAPVIFAGEKKVDDISIEKTRVLLNNYISYAEKVIIDLPYSKYKLALTELLGFIKNG